MFRRILQTMTLGVFLVTGTSQATVVHVFDTITAGQSALTSLVTTAGGTLSSVNFTGLSSGSTWDFGDFEIDTTDGSSASIYSASYNDSTGEMISIDPVDAGDNGAGSGITFTFDSAINALGFEVGDWATCCFTSELFISFDGGAEVKVASADTYSDNPATAAGGSSGDAIFVGAIDDSSTFTTVTFFGNGFGEILTAGGTVFYTALDIGSVVDPNDIPEPSALAIFGLGLLWMAGRRRKMKI